MPLDTTLQPTTPVGFLDRQEAYWTRLLALADKGLPKARCLQFARVWTQGASVHVRRVMLVPKEWARYVDYSTANCLPRDCWRRRLSPQATLMSSCA